MWWENHEAQEYEYRHAGITERHGAVPAGLLVAAVILFVLGLARIIAVWTS